MSARAAAPKTVRVYCDEDGYEPFNEWFTGLRDKKGQEHIRNRIKRLSAGLYGDCKSVGEGILELRLFIGPGYRIYIGEDEKNIVLLLCGGDKSTQKQDVKSAKAYWRDYLK